MQKPYRLAVYFFAVALLMTVPMRTAHSQGHEGSYSARQPDQQLFDPRDDQALQENHTRETPGQFHSSQQDLIDQKQPAQQQSQGKWQFYQQSRPEQAQDQQRQYKDQGTQQQAKQKERELQFKKMIGSKVSVKDGSEYGTIKDFMVDSQGRVAFVLISHGGLWGLGQEAIAVPIETLSFNTTDQKFALNLSKDELENAPTADKEQMSESKVLQIYRFYGIQPYWTTEGYSTGSNRQ